MLFRSQFENKDNCFHIHLTLVPHLPSSGEFKTKPTQHSVKELREIGITADCIVCRTHLPFKQDIKRKIALFCDVAPESVIMSTDAKSIYEVPLLMKKENLHEVALKQLGRKSNPLDLKAWRSYLNTTFKEDKPKTTIALIGKYTELSDAYISVVEALKHASAVNKCELEIGRAHV